MKDRNVQYPHRYQLVPVAGETNVYDFVPVPGTITEAGTPINKATLLSDATAALYGLTGDDATVDGVLSRAKELMQEAVIVNVSTLDDELVAGQIVTLTNLTIPAMSEVYTLKTGEGQANFSVLAGHSYYVSVNDKVGYITPSQSATHEAIADNNRVIDMIYSAPLSALSWSKISVISEAGLASDYWLVGDEKDIVVNGETLTLQIFDFNHDNKTAGGKAGITFGMKDLMATKRRMEATSINTNGWGGCEMRAWIINTLIGQLPSDLQNVLKPVDKKTSAGNTSDTINTTSDKVFLFSEIECFGAVTHSKEGEGSKYAIFTDATSRIKKLTNGSGAADLWWNRSPAAVNATNFIAIQSTGITGSNGAINARGVAFGFCV